MAGHVWRIEGDDLDAFYAGVDGQRPAGVQALGLLCDTDGIQVRVNEATWSEPLGVSE